MVGVPHNRVKNHRCDVRVLAVKEKSTDEKAEGGANYRKVSSKKLGPASAGPDIRIGYR